MFLRLTSAWVQVTVDHEKCEIWKVEVKQRPLSLKVSAPLQAYHCSDTIPLNAWLLLLAHLAHLWLTEHLDPT